MFKDAVGNEVAVGDTVATNVLSYKRSYLRVGKVTEITPATQKPRAYRDYDYKTRQYGEWKERIIDVPAYIRIQYVTGGRTVGVTRSHSVVKVAS